MFELSSYAKKTFFFISRRFIVKIIECSADSKLLYLHLVKREIMRSRAARKEFLSTQAVIDELHL